MPPRILFFTWALLAMLPGAASSATSPGTSSVVSRPPTLIAPSDNASTPPRLGDDTYFFTGDEDEKVPLEVVPGGFFVFDQLADTGDAARAVHGELEAALGATLERTSFKDALGSAYGHPPAQSALFTDRPHALVVGPYLRSRNASSPPPLDHAASYAEVRNLIQQAAALLASSQGERYVASPLYLHRTPADGHPQLVGHTFLMSTQPIRVSFDPGVSAARAEAILQSVVGGTTLRIRNDLGSQPVHEVGVVHLTDGMEVLRRANTLHQHPEVRWASSLWSGRPVGGPSGGGGSAPGVSPIPATDAVGRLGLAVVLALLALNLIRRPS